MTIEEKLKAYRRKKSKEKMMNSIKSTVRKVFSWNRGDNAGKLAEESSKDEEVRLGRLFLLFSPFVNNARILITL